MKLFDMFTKKLFGFTNRQVKDMQDTHSQIKDLHNEFIEVFADEQRALRELSETTARLKQARIDCEKSFNKYNFNIKELKALTRDLPR